MKYSKVKHEVDNDDRRAQLSRNCCSTKDNVPELQRYGVVVVACVVAVVVVVVVHSFVSWRVVRIHFSKLVISNTDL